MPAGTIALAAAGGVLLIVGIVFFATRDPAPVVQPPPPPKKKAVDPHEEKRDEAMIWFQVELLEAPGANSRSGDEIEAILDAGKKRGYHTVPGMDWNVWTKKVYKKLLRREPNHPAANRAFGRIPITDYPGFTKVYKRLRHWASLPPEFEAVREDLYARTRTRPKTAYPAYEPKEYERIRGVLDRFREWDGQMNADPTAIAIHKALARVKTDPILGEYEFAHVELHPWVLFYASRKLVAKNESEDEQRRVDRERARLRKRLQAFRPFVSAYLKFFRANWLKPLGLKEFQKDELLFVWVFGDRKAWEGYGKRIGTHLTPGMLGYFDPSDHWVFLFEDVRDKVKVEASLAHELTHQLHWHFSHEADQKSTGFFNHFVRSKAVWFKEGWAEYAGSLKMKGARYGFGAPSDLRVKSLRALHKYKIPLLPLRDLVRRDDYRGWLLHMTREWLPRQRIKIKAEVLFSLMMEMLYAQSWLFVHFLYEFEDGKYRDKALRFTKATLKGYLGHRGVSGYAKAHEVFEEIFGLRTKADWARFQKEYEEHLTAMFYAVGK